MSISNNVSTNEKQNEYLLSNYCSKCGTKILKDSKFCLHCGTVLSLNKNDIKNHLTFQKEDAKKRILFSLFSTTLIWISVLISSFFSPDLVSGSEQQHLPLVMWTIWVWGLIATIFTIRLFREQGDMTVFKIQSIAIGVLWIFIALITTFSPPFVTGSDPTSIPLISLITPLIGCILTASVWFIGKPANNY